MTRRWHGWKVLTAVAATVVSFSIAYYVQSAQFTEILTLRGGRNYDDFPEEPGIVPSYLLGRVYNASDFRNERGIVPPFWSCSRGACNSSEVWGPCYAPRGAVDWGKQIAKDQGKQEGPVFHHEPGRGETRDDLADYCRPGFIIIGAGKCGTSSLYHYLTSHPKVLPAKEKQIHYFKYYKDYPMKWYYVSHDRVCAFRSTSLHSRHVPHHAQPSLVERNTSLRLLPSWHQELS